MPLSALNAALPGVQFIVEVAFVNNPFGTLTWTDISHRALEIHTKRGRQYELGHNEAGEAQLVLRNNDGALDPNNTASPFWPQVLPMRPIRVRAIYQGVSYPLWSGFVERWPQRWNATTRYGTVEVTAVDAFKSVLGFVPGDPYDTKVRKDFGVFTGGAGVNTAGWMFQAFDGSGPYQEQAGSGAVAQPAGTTTKAQPSPCRTAAVFAGADSISVSHYGTMGEAWFNPTQLPAAEGAAQVLYAATETGTGDSTTAGGVLDPSYYGSGPAVVLWKPYRNLIGADADALCTGSVAGWAVESGGVATITATASGMSYSATTNTPSVSLTAKIPVTAGWYYGFAGVCSSSAPISVSMRWFNASGTLLSTSGNAAYVTTANPTVCSNGVSGGVLAPAGATQMQIVIVPTNTGWTLGTMGVVSDSGRGASWAAMSGVMRWLPSQGNTAALTVVLPPNGAGGMNYYTTGLPAANTWHMVAWCAGGYVTSGGGSTTDMISLDGAAVSTASPRNVSVTAGSVNAGGKLGTGFYGQMAGVYLATPTAGIIDVQQSYAQQHYSYGTTAAGAARTHDFPAELTSARVTDVLTSVGFTSGQWNVQTGLTQMSASGSVAGTSAVTLLQQAADTELGNVFVNAAGTVVFQARSNRNSPTVQATFGDGPGEVPYLADLVIDFDDTYIYNDIQVQQAGASPAYTFEPQDVGSQNTYGVRTLSRTVQAANQADVQGMGNTLLAWYKQARQRIPTVTLEGLSNPAVIPQILQREIGDLITVNRRPAGAPQISLNSFIDGVELDITPQLFKAKYLTTPQYPNATF